ncbi:MAG: phage tail tape measure protein [Butyrivibrio sp.]|nr:phage tail tape measure protein [Butyrivibrio sp.]
MAGSRKTEYELAIQVGGKVAASFGNSVRDVGSGFDTITNMAKSAAKLISGAFAAVKVGQFISDAVDTYSEFEQSMANTAAVANASAYEYKQLENAAREMGKATTKTAAESADALGYMMLAGWDVNEAIEGLEPVLRLSEATQMDLATCSDLVTDSMSALGLSVDDLSDYLDICTAANNSANTTSEALMEAFIGVGGAARTVGADLYDTATALGVLANNGTKGAQAGTALNAMLVRMTSKDAAINAMEALGVSAFDSSGSFRGLETVLTDLQGVMSKLTTEEQAYYMSQIAGTNYYTEMGYLLDSVTEKADGTGSAWSNLSDKLEDSDGALNKMADTVTDTLQGAFARLNSAADDAKISFAQAFSGDLKGVINDLAGYIPILTQKFIEFATKAAPKISKGFDIVKKGAAAAWTGFTTVGGWIIDHFDAIKIAIIGIGSAIVAYKVINGIIGMANALKSLSFVATNPYLAILVGIAAAIVGVASALRAAEKQAAKSNLAEHFGDIALSMEDVEQVAQHIVNNKYLTSIHDSLEAFGELDGIADSMRDSIKVINKMNWKVSIGMELSKDEQESYKAEIQNYVEQAQSYVEQERYALNLNLSLFAEGSVERQNIVNKLDLFYSDVSSELAELGTQLNQKVNEAFEDGLLEIDEIKEITELQEQMARIQEKLSTGDFDARLKVLELQYSGADLDSDSFQALQEEIAKEVEIAGAKYEDALQKRIAKAQIMLEDGRFTEAEYDTAVREFHEDYLEQMANLESKALSFQTNTVLQNYADEAEAFGEHTDSVLDKYAYGGGNMAAWRDDPAGMYQAMTEEVYNNDIPEAAKDGILMLLDVMGPVAEEAEELKKKYELLGDEAPEELRKAIDDYNRLSAMAYQNKHFKEQGDYAAVWDTTLQAMANDGRFDEILELLKKEGAEIPEAFAEEIEAAQTDAIKPAINGVYAYSEDYFKEVFSNDFEVHSGVNVIFEPAYQQYLADNSENKAYSRNVRTKEKMRGHALGGIFDTPHIAWFAEDGPEAAIPLDGSGNAISLWEKVGQLLGIFDGGVKESKGTSLYNGLVSNQTYDNSVTDASNDSRQIVYSPQITIEGNASREDLDEAFHIAIEEFKEMYNQMVAERSRVSFSQAQRW